MGRGGPFALPNFRVHCRLHIHGQAGAANIQNVLRCCDGDRTLATWLLENALGVPAIAEHTRNEIAGRGHFRIVTEDIS